MPIKINDVQIGKWENLNEGAKIQFFIPTVRIVDALELAALRNRIANLTIELDEEHLP